MNEFKRMILKVSNIEDEVATIPASNDHSDGSWLNTDIYIGELFLNTVDNLLQTRTETGIINLVSGGSGVTNFLGLTDTPSVYAGSGSYTVKVKSDASALEFVEDTNDNLISTITLDFSRDLLLTDKDKNLENVSSITLTVPLNSSVAFPIGTQIFFTKKAETLVIANAVGVTINSVDNLLELGRLNCGASLLKISTDEWNLIGELV